jgi:hypothetical protein
MNSKAAAPPTIQSICWLPDELARRGSDEAERESTRSDVSSLDFRGEAVRGVLAPAPFTAYPLAGRSPEESEEAAGTLTDSPHVLQTANWPARESRTWYFVLQEEHLTVIGMALDPRLDRMQQALERVILAAKNADCNPKLCR